MASPRVVQPPLTCKIGVAEPHPSALGVARIPSGLEGGSATPCPKV
jgi:hypothetical protein